MKICLGKDVPVNNGDPTVKIKYTEKDFLNAVEKISNDIKKCYGDKKIGLIGLARGGLPLTVAVSHRLDIREVSVVQIKMTKSNKKWDYGSPEWVNGYINENVDEYIIPSNNGRHIVTPDGLVRCAEFIKSRDKKL